ncbi:tetratricopeptide repeat protein [Actinomycetes bacterium KLBMP 9797]
MTAEQRISAVDGFAYGVIGADLHVFGDGVPLYLLAEYRRAPDPDPDWLRELPSRMLNARNEVVEFTGRDTELASLHAWREEERRLGVRWLHGSAGQGKTRLAAKFAAESQATGWKVIVAIQGPGTVLAPERLREDLRQNGHQGLLLIVDYADRWPLTHLTWLLSNRVLHQPVPTRILMLARTDDGWPAVRAALANLQAGTSALRLRALDDGGDLRHQMFRTARDGFAERYRIDDPHAIRPPPALDEPAMGLTLAIHMAALVAVDAYVSGRHTPQGVEALTIYLLDREQLFWRRRYLDDHTLGPTDGTPHTPPAVMNRIVFTAALTGAMPHPAGVALLQRIDAEADHERSLADHGACYPPTDAGMVLEPLYPDRLAEDFLALTLPGHDADYPAQSWAADVNDTVLTDGPWLGRSFAFLAAASERWPHVGARYLFPVLRRQPRLLLSAGSAAMAAVAAVSDVDFPALHAVADAAPRQRSVNLDVGMAAITARLTAHRLATATDAHERSELYHELGRRLLNAGRHREALAATEAEAALSRELASADSQTLPNLSVSLVNLGQTMAKVGRHEESVAATEEAVAIRRRLAAADPEFGLPLARSLNALGSRLANLGRIDEALAAAEEGAALFRRLMSGRDDVFDEWAGILVNLGNRRAAAGRHAEALEAAREAIEWYRVFPPEYRITVAPDIAAALLSLSKALTQADQHGEALAVSEEAVALHRELVVANPAFRSGLAMALDNLGADLSHLGRHEEALRSTQEALTILRRIEPENPDGIRPTLGLTLINLGGRLSNIGQRQQALIVTEEAVATLRTLTGRYPDTVRDLLAGALRNLATTLSALGRHDEALAIGEEVVSVCRVIVAEHPSPQAFKSLTESLNILGMLRLDMGLRAQAVAAAEEAVAFARSQSSASEDARFILAASLSNLGTILASIDRAGEAATADDEAVLLLRQLALAQPGHYLPHLASALNNLASRRFDLRQRRRAWAAAYEAVALYRELAEERPGAHLPGLAGALTNLGSLLAVPGFRKQALAATREAVMLFRTLAEESPSHQPDLATALGNLSLDLLAAGSREEALAAVEEALTRYRELVANNASRFLPDLARTLTAAAKVRPASQGALPAAEEALAIYTGLAQDEPQTFAGPARSARAGLATVLKALGRKAEAKEILRALKRKP